MASKAEKALQAQLAQLQAAIAQMQNPASNPAQQFLTQQALDGANYFNKGEFSTLPKGMFFDFKLPQEDIARYKKLTNVNQGGTFALAGNSAGGRGKAQALQGKYLSDRFARDAQQNYQDNISNAAKNVQGGLAQAAGAQSQNQAQIVSALSNMYSNMANQPKKPSAWGSVLGAIGRII